eukprot:6456096-Amphidinium_carterae.1
MGKSSQSLADGVYAALWDHASVLGSFGRSCLDAVAVRKCHLASFQREREREREHVNVFGTFYGQCVAKNCGRFQQEWSNKVSNLHLCAD